MKLENERVAALRVGLLSLLIVALAVGHGMNGWVRGVCLIAGLVLLVRSSSSQEPPGGGSFSGNATSWMEMNPLDSLDQFIGVWLFP